MKKIFNELTLLEEIEKIWGKHGAHSEIYRTILKKLEESNKSSVMPSDKEMVVAMGELAEKQRGAHQDNYVAYKFGFRACYEWLLCNFNFGEYSELQMQQCWDQAIEYYTDTSDFPMGDGKKTELNFEQFIDTLKK